MIDRLFDRFEMLARKPGAGDPLDHLSPRLRCCPVKSYVVFFETENATVRIKRVLHGARDLRKLLDGDEQSDRRQTSKESNHDQPVY